MTADEKFKRAMAMSDDLLSRLRSIDNRGLLLLDMFAGLWRDRNNTPVVTTVYEAYQEIIAPVRHLMNGKSKH